MNYTYKEVKETTMDITTKKLVGTNLVEWYGKKTTILNGEEKITTRCGITSKDVIDSHSTPTFPTNKIYAPNMYDNYAYVMKITKEKYEKIMCGDLFVYDMDIFEDVDEKNIRNDDYITILWNPGSYKIADIHYNLISIPMRLGYCSTGLTNKYYDLNIALSVLKESPYVLKKETLRIENIPYYNAYDGETQRIEFICKLDLKDYIELQKYDSSLAQRKIVDNIILKGAGRI